MSRQRRLSEDPRVVPLDNRLRRAGNRLDWEQMKINFYATLRKVVGDKTVEIDLPERLTVQQMLTAILERYPGLRREMLAPDGTLYPHVHIFINGRDAQYLAHSLDTPIEPGDTVNIFPPVGGGWR
jgi:sulfur-carrier protein